MALQAGNENSSASPSTTRSKYWNNNNGNSIHAQSDSPWPKKRCIHERSTSHEPDQMRLRYLPTSTTTVANKQQYKRKFEDAFDFGPKTATGVKVEPQDEHVTTRPTTLIRHFAASKSGQPATASKSTALSPKPDEAAIASRWTTGDLLERSALVTTLAYVWDGAVTEATIALVLRRAREVAPSGKGDVYDTAFIRSILADLDTHRIDSDRRAAVTELLARPLQQQLENLRSSSESLLSCLASINTPQPSSPSSRTPRQSN
jgi:hypothetical protein